MSTVTIVSESKQLIDISVIMPTVFWTGTFERCALRVLSLLGSSAASAEVVFVFDGTAPRPPKWLDRPGVTIVTTGTRSGLARARNLAAQTARGEILFFVDSDVELSSDAITRVHDAFAADPDLVGLLGTYDDQPMDDGVVSTFRNLLHHHKHVSHSGRANTFWSGCGAMRTPAFLECGGFDQSHVHPSINDLDLGMRVAAIGGKIMISPAVRCKHLRRWTLASMVITDVVHRATPWTQLSRNRLAFPPTLSLDWRGRSSGVCAVILAVCLAVLIVCDLKESATAWVALACGFALIVMNIDFYRLCLRNRGIKFAASSIVLHWFYLVYSSLTFGAVAIREVWRRFSRSVSCDPEQHLPTATDVLPTEVIDLPVVRN